MKRQFTREQKEVLDILAAENYETWIEDMETGAYLKNTFAGEGEYAIWNKWLQNSNYRL